MAVQSKALISHLKSAFVFCVSFAGGSFGTYLALQPIGSMMTFEVNGRTEVKEGLTHKLFDRTDIGSLLRLKILCLLSLPPQLPPLPFAASYNSDVSQLLFAGADSNYFLPSLLLC